MGYFNDSQKAHKKAMEEYRWRANLVGKSNPFYKKYVDLRNYHQSVYYKQEYEKRVLKKDERKRIYKHWCE